MPRIRFQVFHQESFLRKVIYVAFQKNLHLISEEEFKSCASYKLSLLNLSSEPKKIAESLFEWLELPMQTLLKEKGGIESILKNYGDDENFKRSLIILDDMKQGVCEAYASVDLAKWLEGAMDPGKFTERDPIEQLIIWTLEEPITLQLINDLVCSVRSLFFSNEFFGNLSVVENYTNNNESINIENERYKSITRVFDGLGCITKSNLRNLFKQLTEYIYPIGILLNDINHTINVVQFNGMIITTDPDGEIYSTDSGTRKN